MHTQFPAYILIAHFSRSLCTFDCPREFSIAPGKRTRDLSQSRGQVMLTYLGLVQRSLVWFLAPVGNFVIFSSSNTICTVHRGVRVHSLECESKSNMILLSCEENVNACIRLLLITYCLMLWKSYCDVVVAIVQFVKRFHEEVLMKVWSVWVIDRVNHWPME